MKSSPIITVITVVYNDATSLEETIKSVLNQTYSNVEYIIIDGQSTDGTLDIINKYQENIAYWITEPDNGLYDAMNKGIDSASGEWINFMNAGDIYYNENVLKDVFHNQDYEGYDVLFGSVEHKYHTVKNIRPIGDLKSLWKGMQFSHQSTFFKTSNHKKLKYDLKYNFAADYNFIYNLYNSNFEFKSLNEIIATKLVSGLTETNIIKSIKERYKIVTMREDTIKVHLYYTGQLIRNYLKRIIPVLLIDKYRSFKYQK